MSKHPKPPACDGCSLKDAGRGFVPPSGPPASRILFMGESPGRTEVDTGIGFTGAAGGKLNHILYRIGRDRAAARVHNLIQCQPPGDKLENTWYENSAIAQCWRHREPVMEEPRPVIVALGAVPARTLLRTPSANIKDLHGTVTQVEVAQGVLAWVVCTFHPSHLVRGAHNLTGTVAFDLTRAYEIHDSGEWEPDIPTLLCDPGPAEFEHFVNGYLELLRLDPLRTWLSVDVETPDKQRELDEGELRSVDRSMQIIRINFAYSTDVGLTVPFCEPYITIMRRMLEAAGPKWFWNKPYDLKRLKQHFRIPLVSCFDGMDAWKVLHSDTPRGLGFVAPFYSTAGAWKHLSAVNPAFYAAMDAVQTQRCAYGLAADLHGKGQWDSFFRHMHEFGVYATQPGSDVGLKIDRRALEGWDEPDGTHVVGMREKLAAKSQDLRDAMQTLVPDELKPLHPKDGWVQRPEGEAYVWPKDGEPGSRPRFILEKWVELPVRICKTCTQAQVPTRHRCKDPETGKPSKTLVAHVVNEVTKVPRYYVREDFNPASPPQVLAYIKWAGHKPGRNKGKETTNRETIERLADGKGKSKRDERARELYVHVLDDRDVKKVLGTYVDGTLRRLALDREAGILDDRLHPTVTNNPSTLRTAYSDPNLQNVVADRRGGESLSAGFRRAVVAEAGCDLVELDWSGIEGVIVGWCMGDPDYIRKSWTGMHDHVTAAVCGRPISMDLPVDEVMRELAAIKEQEDQPGGKRDPIKRVVHGTNYLLTPFGMAKRFRKLFPSAEAAAQLQAAYYAFAPSLHPWQKGQQALAEQQEFLGGKGAHPFAYRHEFYNVRNYEVISEAQALVFQRLNRTQGASIDIRFMNGRWYKVTPGEDARRAVAFYPQSIAAGIIRETSLLLFKPGEALAQGYPDWYIGDVWHGQTPLRAIIHDSFLLELLRDARQAEIIRKVSECMTRPIRQLPMPLEWGLGPFLQFGVGVKLGPDWASMKKVKVAQPWLQVMQGEDRGRELGEITIPAATFGIYDDVVLDEELPDDDWQPDAVY